MEGLFRSDDLAVETACRRTEELRQEEQKIEKEMDDLRSSLEDLQKEKNALLDHLASAKHNTYKLIQAVRTEFGIQPSSRVSEFDRESVEEKDIKDLLINNSEELRKLRGITERMRACSGTSTSSMRSYIEDLESSAARASNRLQSLRSEMDFLRRRIELLRENRRRLENSSIEN